KNHFRNRVPEPTLSPQGRLKGSLNRSQMRRFFSNQAQALRVRLVRPAIPSSRTMLHGPSLTAVISETNHYRPGEGVSPRRLLSFNNKHETTPEIPGLASTNSRWKNNPHKHTLVPLEGNDQLRNRLLLPL